ncbi:MULTISPECIES: protein-disulfide reductase DsbD [unclassified Polynucleobacter]|uniref:protein-disulfide reductase DsbD n=1 Tax=unclassified Polynucleobacter TaxID=2640945 RepID=UPI0008D1CBD0|nr:MULTISPECIES: protein-disulfide reductase DsbD [unclassified Polynucleobacter]OHC09007.1 MAG: protein-disulfide reductase [Polynucleobacter sp. GWA2_45_21]HBK43426.1 protein-disulfide reductase [Polynucleobacter sp.]
MRVINQFISVLAAFHFLLGNAFATSEFLPPEKAFQAEATWVANTNDIELEIFPAKSYYIYQESLHFKMGSQPNKLEAVKAPLPPGIEKFDETFQKKMQVYKQAFLLTLDKKAEAGKPLYLELELQGCAEAGICYPPMTLKFLLAGPGVKAGPIPEVLDGASNSSKKEFSLVDLWRERDDVNAISRLLESTPTGYLFLAFFILGLALAFTPCVLPMLPILSSVVFGTQGKQSIGKGRASLLAMAYVLGMACVYALAGVLMAALGGSVQRALQSPIALIGFALLLLALSGSLFGLYELRMPQSWQEKVDQLAGRHKGGSFFGAFALGGISTLVASPCITAPLAGVLAFIAQTGSMSLGAGLLFVMALGMGLPLLFIAIEARILIPSTGIWMVWLQRTLGVLLVATAAWIASPLLQSSNEAGGKMMANGQRQHQIGNANFAVIQSSAQLDQFLTQAKEQKKLVLLDFYADWCISCKEMEINTFANSEVNQELQKFVLLQADVTKNSPENQELLKRFGLFGPPGILIFDLNSEELKDQRVIGFMPPQRFAERLKKALGN